MNAAAPGDKASASDGAGTSSADGASVEELLHLAELAVTDAPRTLGADRTLPAVLLARRALEAVLDDWWDDTEPGMAEVSDRAQQITLPFYAEANLAHDLIWAWTQLSATCHHHAYSQPPTADELARLVGVVREAAEGLGAGSGRQSGTHHQQSDDQTDRVAADE